MNSMSMRNALSKDLLPASSAYVSNATISLYVFASVAVFLRSLSVTSPRRCEKESHSKAHGSKSAFTAIVRDSMVKAGRPAVFGDSRTILLVFTNWTAAKYFEIALSAAVGNEGLPREKRANALGKPSYVNADGKITRYSPRNNFPIMGKDGTGNYWLSGVMRSGLWSEIERSLAAL